MSSQATEAVPRAGGRISILLGEDMQDPDLEKIECNGLILNCWQFYAARRGLTPVQVAVSTLAPKPSWRKDSLLVEMFTAIQQKLPAI
jgi:hypothetical protein